MELKGFTRVRLAAGESREVALLLRLSDLSFPDAGMRRVVEPGDIRILVGASSEDVRLRGTLTLTPASP
jgi:beta-glucosidase